MMNKIAQIQIGPEGGFKGFGILGLENRDPKIASFIFADFLTSTIGVISIIAIIWFIVIIITGSVSIMTSGGDKNSLEAAKKKIANGLIGVVLVIIGIFIVQLVGTIIGINFLNIPDLIFRSTQK